MEVKEYFNKLYPRWVEEDYGEGETIHSLFIGNLKIAYFKSVNNKPEIVEGDRVPHTYLDTSIIVPYPELVPGAYADFGPDEEITIDSVKNLIESDFYAWKELAELIMGQARAIG